MITYTNIDDFERIGNGIFFFFFFWFWNGNYWVVYFDYTLD